MTSVTVHVVRVFCDENGDFGNELGIVDSSPQTDGHEQQIAAELGFSETVFVDDLADGVVTIRIFTPAGELPFAGHPSVGTAWWLTSIGTPVTTLVEKAGDVAVRHDGELTWITGRAEWAPAFKWMPQPTPADVDALDPHAFDTGMNYPWSWIDEEAGVLRSRMFGSEHHIDEDEATGAAAVAITTHLGRDLDIRQGRGSRMLTRQVAGGFVHIAGRTIYDRQLSQPVPR